MDDHQMSHIGEGGIEWLSQKLKETHVKKILLYRSRNSFPAIAAQSGLELLLKDYVVQVAEPIDGPHTALGAEQVITTVPPRKRFQDRHSVL